VDVAKCSSRKEAEERLSVYVSEPSTMQFLMKNMYWKEAGLLDWRFNLKALDNHIDDVLAALPEEEIDCETLFILGGKSGYVTPNDFESIRGLIPSAQFETIEEAGHWVHAEAPVKFLELVEKYMEFHG